MSRPNLNFHPNYLKSALDNEYQIVASAKSGTRDSALCKAAFKLGQLPIPENAVVECLVAAAQACGLLGETGISAVHATIQSGMEAGHKNPRAPGSDRQRGADLAIGALGPDEAARAPASFPAATQAIKPFDVDGQLPNELRRGRQFTAEGDHGIQKCRRHRGNDR
jgi:hypothetical protein